MLSDEDDEKLAVALDEFAGIFQPSAKSRAA